MRTNSAYLLTLIVLIIASANTHAQYKYTRFSLELQAGPTFGFTSVPNSIGSYAEIGFRGALSKYLSGKISYSIGSMRGENNVTVITPPATDVSNYVSYTTSYQHVSGRGYLNLERVFKLRTKPFFHRLNPYFVLGGGLMFPDIESQRVDGQYKHYKDNVRFYTNIVGFDFKYYLTNRFNLNFGTELNIIQTYYLDGAYSDEKYDNFLAVYIGASYNFAANSDRKHLEWFNLDNKEDIIIKAVEVKDPELKPALKDETKPVVDSVEQVKPAEPQKETEIIENTDTVKSTIIADNKPVEVKKDTAATVIAKAEPAKPQTPSVPSVKAQPKADEPTKQADEIGKYNVIAATYASNKYAKLYCAKLRKQGYDAQVIRGVNSRMYKITVFNTNDRKEAFKQMRKIKAGDFPQAWVHIYHPKPKD